jgi:hypothetical protein
MRRYRTAYAHVPRLVQLGIVLLAVGIVVDLLYHALLIPWGLSAQHGHGGGEALGHLVTLLGMTTIMIGIFHRQYRRRRSAVHRPRQSGQHPVDR